MKQLIRWVSILLIVAMGTCCMSPTAQYPSTPTTAERLQQTTVALVEVRETKTGLLHTSAFCSGVWVSQNEIITAAHCVEPPTALLAQIFGPEILTEFDLDPVGNEYNFLVQQDIGEQDIEEVIVTHVRAATVTVYDPDKDLALLKVTDKDDIPKDHPIANVRKSDVHAGEGVHVVGHTIGLWWTYTRGYVSAERWMKGPHEEQVHVLQISAPVWGGNSGGGAFDEEGNIIGIASYITKAGPNLSFFVHKNVVLVFLINNGVEL